MLPLLSHLLPTQAKYSSELGRPAPEVSLDTAHWLPPPPKEGRTHTHDDEFQSW